MTDLDKIREIGDPADRLAALAVSIPALEQALADARKLRDDTIKEYREQQGRAVTVSQIAERAGVSVATVKAVLR